MGVAEVREIAKAGLFRCDKEKIVIVFRPEPACAPAQVTFSGVPQTGLKRPGDHLFQRRVADQRIG